MIKHITLRKRVFIGFFIAVIFNFVSLFVWNNFYVKPHIEQILNDEENLKSEILAIDYTSYEELDLKLANNKRIKYSIQNLDSSFIKKVDLKKFDKPFISEVIKVDNNDYLLKVYHKNNINVYRVIILFFEIQAILLLIIFIIAGYITNRGILKPLDRLINDIRNYKFGKKPFREKVKNEFDLIQNEFVNLTDSLDKEKSEQTRIIASISHDIKTPLTSIIGYSDLMASKDLTREEIYKYNEKINLKSKTIKEILNNFDDYLINNTNQTLKLESIKIRDLVKELDSDYRTDLEVNKIKFIIECNCLNDNIIIDIMKIKRVFANIISNSVRFLNKDGLIRVNIEKSKGVYKFKISDNGSGIAEEKITKIFEPLYTTDNSRKISGLGLSICKEFIVLHGGSIRAYNDSGLTIEFTIPYQEKKS